MKLTSPARMNVVFLGTPPYKSLISTPEELQSHFHPEHWRDLLKSGLRPEIIWDANIFSCPPDRISRILGINPVTVTSALAIPYLGTDFVRLKIFPPQVDAKGHKIKYLQQKQSGNHLYFPPNFFDRIKDLRQKIFICEGEKKTLRADQEKLCALGIGGIYGWTQKGTKNLLDDFDVISWTHREVRIAPDGDWVSNEMVRRGTIELCNALSARGARVKLLDLNLARAA